MKGNGYRRMLDLACWKTRLSRAILSAILALLGCNRDLPEAGETSDPRRPVGEFNDGNRFGTLFCAIADDHGAFLEHARPCQEALHNLGERVHSGAALPASSRHLASHHSGHKESEALRLCGAVT